jgi:fumarylacetoacetase
MDDKNEKVGIACLFERMLPQNKLSDLNEYSSVYLADGDEVVMDGWCRNQKGEPLFGFGDCRGVVMPAKLPA